MANATVGVLRVLLTANAAEYESVLKRAADSAKAFARETKQIGQSLSSVGSALTKGLTLPLVGIAGAAIHAGMDFEKSMNQIKGVLQPTAAQMDQVRQTAMKMGADTVFSATDAADAMLELGKAGFTTENAIGSVGDVLQLAAASGLSMADAASLSARALNAFGLEAGDLSHVNDVLAQAVNTTSLEIADLQIGFQYIGPIARGFGMSIESASAALGIMRDSGIAAETSGRALREGLGRLANPVKSVRDVLGDLGISLKSVDPSMHSLAEIVGTLQAKGLTAAESLKLFGDAAGPGMFALVQKGQFALENLTKGLQNSGGAAKKMADAMMEGLPGAIEQLRGSVETALLGINKAIEPAVIGLANIAKQIADAVTTTLVPAFMALPQPVQMATLGFLGIAAAAGPLIFLLGQLALSVSAITAAFAANGAATLIMGRGFQAATTYLPTFTAALSAMHARLALAAGAAAVFTGVLQGLGIMVAFVAAAFIGWNIGKWIGEVTGATDALGKLYARILEFVHILPEGTSAQYDAMRAAERLKEAQGGAAAGFDATAEAAKQLKDRIKGEGLAKDVVTLTSTLAELEKAGKATPDVLKRVGMEAAALKQRGATLTPELEKMAAAFTSLPPQIHGTTEELTDAQKAFQRLKDSLSGKDQIEETKMLVDVIRQVGGATKLTADEQQKALATIDAAIEKYEALGQVAPQALQDLRAELARMPALEFRVKVNQESASAAIQDLGQQLLMWRDFRIDTKLLIPSTGVNIAATMEPFKKAIKSAIEPIGFWKGAATSFGEAVRTQLGPAILAAFQGGGSVLKTIGASIGGIFTESIMGAMKDGKFTSGLGKWLQGTFGNMFGGILASIMPGIGSLLGALGGSLLGKLFGGGEGKKVNDLRDSFTSAAGGIDKLAERAAAAGLTLKRFYDAKTVKEYEAAVKELTTAFEDLDARRATATSLFDQIMDAGQTGIPDAMQPAIDQLIALGLLTDEQIGKLKKLGDGSEINVDQLKEDLDSIGGRLESLGPAFQQANIDKTAAKYINAIDRMIKAGGDVGGILFDAKEEVSDLVQQSIKFGTTLPANMKPWIEELARAGLLLDANGDKITDTANLKFGEPIKTEAEIAKEGWDAILKAIQDLVREIRGPLMDAIDDIPDEKKIKFKTEFVNDPNPPDFTPTDPGFARGTLGRVGSFFSNFRGGFPTTLHGWEAVITKSQAVPFAMNVLDSMVARMPPTFNNGLAMSGLETALAGVGGSTTTNTSSNNLLPIFMPGRGLSPYEAAKAAERHLAESGLATDSQGVTTALEKVIAQWFQTYGGDR